MQFYIKYVPYSFHLSFLVWSLEAKILEPELVSTYPPSEKIPPMKNYIGVKVVGNTILHYIRSTQFSFISFRLVVRRKNTGNEISVNVPPCQRVHLIKIYIGVKVVGNSILHHIRSIQFSFISFHLVARGKNMGIRISVNRSKSERVPPIKNYMRVKVVGN